MRHHAKYFSDRSNRCCYSILSVATLCDLVPLNFDLLILDGGKSLGQPIHQLWRSYDYPFLSSETSVIGYHWQCVCSHHACAVLRDLCVGGQPQYFLDPDLSFTLQLTWLYTINVKRVILQKSVLPCVKGHAKMRMRQVTWSVTRGKKQLHIWNPRSHFAYSLYNFYWATITIKGRLQMRFLPMGGFRFKKNKLSFGAKFGAWWGQKWVKC